MDTQNFIKMLEDLYQRWGYLIVFFSSFIEISPFGWIIPGGTILAAGGFFAFGNKDLLLGILISGWLGAWFTFTIAYYLGSKTGFKLVKKLRQEDNAKKAEVLLKNHGGVILTTSMLANLTRFWVAYIAGAQGYSFIRFLLYSSVASLTWVSLLVSVGYIAGTERENLEKALAQLGILAWVFVILAVGVIYWTNKKQSKK